MSKKKNIQLFQKLKEEGTELSENIGQLKMIAPDGIYNPGFNSPEFEGIKNWKDLCGRIYAY